MAAKNKASISIVEEGSGPQSPELYKQPEQAVDSGENANLLAGTIQGRSISGSGSNGYNATNTANENSPPTEEEPCTKKFKCLTATIIALLAVIVLMLVGYNSYLWTTELKSQHYSLNAIIGDASESEPFTFLLQINSTISSAAVTVTAMKPDLELKADVYQSISKPPEYTAILHKNLPKLTGKSRYNYNYLDGDQPVYLTPGSSLLYDVSISNNSGSTCPARLYLFNSQTTYDSFFPPDATIDPIDKSPCLFPDNGTWSFNITDSSAYYVAIAIDTGVSALGNVTVERIQYNTTGLQLDKQLTPANPSHAITTCDTGNGFLCTTQIDDTYLIVSVNKESLVDFQLKTFQVYGTLKIALFSLMLFLVVVLLILVIAIFVIAASMSCKSCNAKGSKR
ncbi:PREDICTED: uncharacterized protein LOC109584748 [Amphimedon queenslandica]|uniref:Uncharacterized protein n=1 Tax=Amphimedon queenslandica TaxID=400682 RepID=A0AAN0JGI0_AMPQE|nr:PREDICTED: uncharacterized protein LOC109584748 [Amphimedon queenslandica]|eukprot:XP_019856145.1 PREDICTED: uncharacterized protein LOC109584748 [Amphimedon queenslandica]